MFDRVCVCIYVHIYVCVCATTLHISRVHTVVNTYMSIYNPNKTVALTEKLSSLVPSL